MANGIRAGLTAAEGRKFAFTVGGAFLVFAAITVHSLFYSAFFEDPLLWGSLAFIGFARANRDAPEV